MKNRIVTAIFPATDWDGEAWHILRHIVSSHTGFFLARAGTIKDPITGKPEFLGMGIYCLEPKSEEERAAVEQDAINAFNSIQQTYLARVFVDPDLSGSPQ